MAAISERSPSLPAGIWLRISFRVTSSARYEAVILVGKYPGHKHVTVIPMPLSSSAKLFAMLTTAALLAL